MFEKYKYLSNMSLFLVSPIDLHVCDVLLLRASSSVDLNETLPGRNSFSKNFGFHVNTR